MGTMEKRKMSKGAHRERENCTCSHLQKERRTSVLEYGKFDDHSIENYLGVIYCIFYCIFVVFLSNEKNEKRFLSANQCNLHHLKNCNYNILDFSIVRLTISTMEHSAKNT